MTRASDKRWSTLIQVAELKGLIGTPEVVVFDCRFSLGDVDEGERQFIDGHIPGAYYAHLDFDLSAPVEAGRTGRHPLPDPADFAEFLELRGVTGDSQVVCYDDKGGAIAARMWWLCKWIGITSVAVLDGGIPAWVGGGNAVQSMVPALPIIKGSVSVVLQHEWMATVTDVVGRDANTLLVDARASSRYSGDNEPIDPVAGHIPGAISLPFADNLSEGGFKSAAELKARFENLEGIASGNVICYCGSGVTAAHNILAIAQAGFPMPRLFAGSWSEWIVDSEREVAVGN